jgi:EAL domain-containing protein (putative c-di-GMP-specific phosphodiesterase class I)/CheY-like chemotaxis protein
MQTKAAEDDKPHVLIVDDDAGVRAIIARVAQRVGYRCTLAADTGHATTALGPDIALIMLDLMMPETDGIELLRILGQHGYGGGVVLMSGVNKRVLATAVALAHALGLQILGSIQKPFALPALTALLQQHLAGHVASGGHPRESHAVSTQELDRAIAEDQFILHYQPQLEVASGAVVGVEALVRWQHPERGLIYPDTFIGLAESWGLINALGGLVMQRGLREFGAIAHPSMPLTLSLNVSAHALDDLALPDTLLALTQTYGVAPERIIVEITESGLARDLTQALDILTRLRMKAFQLSIDDFGTGYAMMQQLCRVPATEIKIDRPFVQDALIDDRASVIVQKTIELGHELGMRVVAEGVETVQHLDLLKAHACDVAQGYLFSQPLALPDLLAWLGQPRARHATTSPGA